MRGCCRTRSGCAGELRRVIGISSVGLHRGHTGVRTRRAYRRDGGGSRPTPPVDVRSGPRIRRPRGGARTPRRCPSRRRRRRRAGGPRRSTGRSWGWRRSKWPLIVEVVDALPHSATGKVAKARLRVSGERTGRRPPRCVRWVTRPGCHLCDDARMVVERVCADLGVGWDEVDVDGDPRLLATSGPPRDARRRPAARLLFGLQEGRLRAALQAG